MGRKSNATIARERQTVTNGADLVFDIAITFPTGEAGTVRYRLPNAHGVVRPAKLNMTSVKQVLYKALSGEYGPKTRIEPML